MKGTWAYALTLAVLLTGCGAKPDASPAETAAQTDLPEPVTDVQTTSPTETETATEAPTTVLTDAETTEPEPTTAPVVYGTGKDGVIASYKAAISEKIDVSKTMNTEYAGSNFSVDYALFDMDHNGTPELLIRYGTCEADYRIAVYTNRDGALVKIADDLGGSHVNFGYDTKENQLVMLQGMMGYGDLYWYDLDENGELRELKSAGGFAYGMEGQPEYDDVMKENNVGYLPFSSSYSFGDEIRTTVYDGTGSYNVADEFLELNFKLLEDYDF